MAKTILSSHIVGEAGVNKFATYCNQHRPYLIFRDVTKSDFGIDGEVELTRTGEDRKTEPTGEIIKVQIKSVNSDNSYIKNETEQKFEFYPKSDDLAYWEKYINKGIQVVLVIYDGRKDRLYCKKVSRTDIYIGQQTLNKNKGMNRITFDKTENLLDEQTSDFTQKFSNEFKSRVNYDVKETLLSNFLMFKQHPRMLFAYKSKFKTKKEIFMHVVDEEAPYFVINGDIIYTFFELGTAYIKFKQEILEEEAKGQMLTYDEIIGDKQMRNRYTELLNAHLSIFLRRKKLVFSKDYRRYYFKKPFEEDILTVSFRTRKLRADSTKNVVKFFTYGKNAFYRHIAVEFKYQYIGRNIFLVLCPKYLFTEDGKKVLEPKLVTKFTNFLTAREFNNAFCDWLNFWWSYLTNDGSEMLVYEDPAYQTLTRPATSGFQSKHPRISLKPYLEETVDFGIYLDTQERLKKSEPEPDFTQTSLF